MIFRTKKFLKVEKKIVDTNKTKYINWNIGRTMKKKCNIRAKSKKKNIDEEKMKSNCDEEKKNKRKYLFCLESRSS